LNIVRPAIRFKLWASSPNFGRVAPSPLLKTQNLKLKTNSIIEGHRHRHFFSPQRSFRFASAVGTRYQGGQKLPR
jgi:hypothetical protein